MAANTSAEADTLKAFIPDLVTAICDCVQSVSDQCLAKGLISETTHRQVLESRGTSEERARTLILSVQNSIKTNGSCLEVFLDVIDEKLPYRPKEKLLREIRKEVSSMCKALVPASQTDTQIVLEDDHLQHILQQNVLFGRYEDSMKKYALTCAQKTLCKEKLHNKTKESERLKGELEKLRSQNSEVGAKELDGTKDRLSVCEMEIGKLKKRIEQLEGIKEEEDMQARQGKNIIIVGTKMFTRMREEQFAAALKEKEEEHKRLLKEEKDELRRKMQEEFDTKLRMKELEHKVVLQEKELKIKELEQSNAKLGQETTPHPPPEHDQQKNTSRSTSRSRKIPRDAYDVPEYKDAYGELLHLASEWTSIGALLGVPPEIITKISVEHKDIHTCLAEVVSHWYKPFPKPVRMDIIQAIEKIEASQAKIRSSDSSYKHNST